jgi:hypothetical protein
MEVEKPWIYTTSAPSWEDVLPEICQAAANRILPAIYHVPAYGGEEAQFEVLAGWFIKHLGSINPELVEWLRCHHPRIFERQGIMCVPARISIPVETPFYGIETEARFPGWPTFGEYIQRLETKLDWHDSFHYGLAMHLAGEWWTKAQTCRLNSDLVLRLADAVYSAFATGMSYTEEPRFRRDLVAEAHRVLQAVYREAAALRVPIKLGEIDGPLPATPTEALVANGFGFVIDNEVVVFDPFAEPEV